MKRFLGIAAALLLAACMIQAANAATIGYTATPLGGDRWQYDYTITNTLADDILAFSIWFDYGKYENLELVSAPADWDVAVTEPELQWGTENYGEFFAFLNTPLVPGGFMSGFAVSFDWKGEQRIPGSQYFEMYDSSLPDGNWSDGYTNGAPPAVPEPGTLVLFGTGIAGLAALYRRKRR